jgi:hypothetical protein
MDNTALALIGHHPELMNWRRLVLLVLVVMLALLVKVEAERLSLDYGLTRPFYFSALNVEWAAPTNALPRTVTVFEVVPDSHPEVTISNLMTIGRFRPSDSIKRFDRDMPLPKGAYGFRAADDGRWLVYVPRQGRIDFDDESAFHGPASDKKVEGVPDDATALELALRLLPLLGISTNDMVKKESGGLRCVFPTGSWGHTDRDTQVHRRGIGFTRSLDGKDVDGQRAVFMEFGNNAKLGRLEVRWSALRPEGNYPAARPTQILQWIKEGRTRVVSLSGPTDARYVRVADIRKLVINSAQSRYPYFDEDDPPKHMRPYAYLTATAEFAPDDTEQVFLLSPLISEGLPKAQRPAHADFSIYPSNRSHRGQ